LAITLKMNRPLEPTVLEVENPPRLVLDFPETVNRVPFKKLPLNADPVKGVRVSQFQSANPAITRVVFDLGNGFSSHRISLSGSSVQVTFFPSGRTDDSPVSSSSVNSEGRGRGLASNPAVGTRETSPVQTGPSPVERVLSNRVLSEIEASHENGNLTITLKMNRPLEPTVLEVENPPRLVLDFSNTENRVPFKKLPLNTDPVKAVRVSQYRSADPAIVRVVFDLGEGVGPHRISFAGTSVRVAFLSGAGAAERSLSSPPMTAEGTGRAWEVSTPGRPDFEEKDASSARTGSSPEELQAAETADRGVAQAEPPVEDSSIPTPGVASTETIPGSAARNPVHAAPALSAKSVNKAVKSKSIELPPPEPVKEPGTADQAKEALAAQGLQGSSDKLRELSGVHAGHTAVASRESRGPARLSLAGTLDRIGASVEQFRKNFKSIACTESVSQIKLGKRETVIYKKDQEYEYMIFTDILNDGVSVEESRVEKKTEGRTKDLPLLVTKGFPTLLLIFHPFYQGSFKYKLMGEETVEGRDLVRIDFKHIKGRRSTSILSLKDKNYPLELEGTAWIDPESYNIQRISAGLVQPMKAVGLETFNSDVLYVPMNFTPDSSTYWMPKTATVEVMTKRQHWRNVHHFEDYRLFSISSESEISIP
jgi:hypothetical protein